MIVRPEDWKICRACRGNVVFAQTNRTSKGSPVVMPVDVDPKKLDANQKLGNVVLSKTGGKYYAGVVGHNQAAGMRDAGVELHHSHMNTCPNADAFRHHYAGRR